MERWLGFVRPPARREIERSGAAQIHNVVFGIADEIYDLLRSSFAFALDITAGGRDAEGGYDIVICGCCSTR